MNIPWRILTFLFFFSCALARGVSAEELQQMNLTVDGVARSALVYVPHINAGEKVPVVFVFHGHGGNSHNAVEKFGINRLWPEAISIYPQGLNTPGRLTDPDGERPGWQQGTGIQGDRDLHFFDAMLARLKADYPVDVKQVYCTGHSNGAGFTYTLWSARPEVFAAVAACSGGGRDAARLTPKPAMILAGTNDELVKFDRQELIMDTVRKVNGCDSKGEPWNSVCTLYPSKGGTPLITFVHQGGHALDPAEPGLIVKFFKEQSVSHRS